MGRVVTFDDLPFRETSPGITRAPITGGDVKDMAAEVIRLAAGSVLTQKAPAGSDLYLFTLSGGVTVSGAGAQRTVGEETFVTIQEDTTVTVANPHGVEATLVGVVAPPSPGTRPGFAGGIAVAARASTPVHHIPAELKRRIYFVSKQAAASDRAHAMIVVYETDTVTGMHMHPDAESMFVLLSGKTRFTVNGQDAILGRGQAVYFPAGDRHGLRVAEGDVSFLEFHLPGVFTTVKG